MEWLPSVPKYVTMGPMASLETVVDDYDAARRSCEPGVFEAFVRLDGELVLDVGAATGGGACESKVRVDPVRERSRPDTKPHLRSVAPDLPFGFLPW